VNSPLSGGPLIAGERVARSSGGTHQHIYPATGRPNASVQLAGATEVDEAVASAWAAHREWMSLTADRRREKLIDLADAVHDRLDDLAQLNVHDYAVPISLAGNGILLERFLRHFAGYVDKPHGVSTPVAESFDVNIVEREPYGVVGVITPWNGALVVIVHSPGGAAPARMGGAAPPANLTPVVAELGGKSAMIVFEDADLDAAAALSAHQGPLIQSGQSCACASRILVHESVYDAFAQRFVGVVENAKAGDPFDPAVVFGPVISQAAADRIIAEVDDAVGNKAGELLTGGSRLGGELAAGYYIEPTVFGGVDNASTLAQTETFGPVVSLMRFGSDAEAVRIANDTPYGLNAFVQTRDLGRAHRTARRLEAGSVWINTFSDISPQGPYGGFKQSGFGRTGGLDGLYEFLQVKNIRIGIG
jgi:aldehyde dehydrogenase (NAD+)